MTVAVGIALGGAAAVGWMLTIALSPKPGAPAVDYAKPIFLATDAPICRTEDGLDVLLRHIKTGVAIADGDNGCFLNPVDRMPVKWVASDGIFQRWDKVSVVGLTGHPEDVWTVSWMLRN